MVERVVRTKPVEVFMLWKNHGFTEYQGSHMYSRVFAYHRVLLMIRVVKASPDLCRYLL